MFEIGFASSVNKPEPFETDMNLGGTGAATFFFLGGNAEVQFIVEGKILTIEVLSAL